MASNGGSQMGGDDHTDEVQELVQEFKMRLWDVARRTLTCPGCQMHLTALRKENWLLYDRLDL